VNIQATAVEAYSYAQRCSNIDRRLLFVHIPKTAGSTMEDVVFKQGKNLTWGRCMFVDGTKGCPRLQYPKYRFGVLDHVTGSDVSELGLVFS
jgi:hypothetical protein